MANKALAATLQQERHLDNSYVSSSLSSFKIYSQRPLERDAVRAYL